MKNRWIIFDIMGVVFEVGDDTNELLVPFIWKYNRNISREKINEEYLKASEGKITSTEFWKRMNVDSNGKEDALSKEYLDTCLTIDPQFFQVASKLKEKYNLAFLSNDVSEWSNYLRVKYNLNDVVSLSIISGDVCVRKPNTEIYDILLKRIGANAENCLFVDDRTKNLLPAKDKGFHTLKFVRNIELQHKNERCISSFEELYEKLETFWDG